MAEAELILRGGRVVDPASGTDAVLDVAVKDGRIAALGPALPGGGEEVAAGGLVVAPGFIDLHVHLRVPGQEHKETVATGSRAAAAGGFTAVCTMPNTEPALDEPALVADLRERSRREGVVRIYPIAAITRGRQGKELAELGALFAAGAVAFSDDGVAVADAGLLRRALEYARMFPAPVVEHCEDRSLAGRGVMHEGRASTVLGLPGIPAAAEEVIVARDLVLAEHTGGRVHIAHVSTAGSVRLIRDAKARGVKVTAEVTPHHLFLTDEDVRADEPSSFKMNPPLRTRADVEALRAGLRDGTLDAVATDHAPHTREEKEVEFDAAPVGVVGLETCVPLVLALVREGVLSLPAAVERLSAGPARCFGLPGGRIAPGQPADLTLLDLGRRVRVDPARFQSKGRNTPFGGWELVGAPVGTLVGGRWVMREGELTDPAREPRAAGR